MELSISPPSSSSDKSDSESPKRLQCQICGEPARGKHFGAVSCRACAAFFRRASSMMYSVQQCKKNNNCKLLHGNGFFHCKKCRLQKCYQAGMTSENFQFNRDLLNVEKTKRIPNTIEKFIGRPYFVISCEPKQLKMTRNYIDCHSLVDKGMQIIFKGSETPLSGKNTLSKLAFGLQKMEDKMNMNPPTVMKRYGKEECLTFWETDFMRAAEFLSYFDEFQRLPGLQKVTLEKDHLILDGLKPKFQSKILRSVWHVWSRLDKLATTAFGRRRGICGDKVMFSLGSEYSICDLKNVELDLTWCARLSNPEMQFFYDTSENNLLYKLAPEMMKLNPSHVELSFMYCHLILTHVGQRFSGEIQEIADKYIEILSNNLHDYYVNQIDQPRYARRMQQLLGITRRIREEVLHARSKLEIARLFDVYTATFSHMECFEDL